MLRKLALAGLLFMAAAVCATVANAADQPLYEPVPGWVKPIPIPKAVTATSGAAIQVRLQDVQTLFGADNDQFYSEDAYQILTAQGLSAAGNAILTWNPDHDTLVIHRLQILRGSQAIDALASGRKFTVLRRETSLERAALDGTLTATLQLEGLQVGDTVDMAITIRHHDPVFQGRSESFAAMNRPGVIGRLHIREIWPASKPMRWRATDGLETPVVKASADGTELLIDQINVEAPRPPRDAPSRFYNIGQLEISQFKSWAEVSGLMEPLYRKASTLGPGSALKAEIDKIKVSTADPKARTLAALRLVQDQTRYLFLGMDSGGFVPADADLTWARRFGDCKGKTALLLAVLKGLGVEAQPVLVNTGAGDGLDERLPLLEIFDHVLVRARIGDKTYWLDGTRLGDHNIDLIKAPNYHWALPIQATGAGLEKLSPTLLDDPYFESLVKLDSSAGLDSPAPIHVEHIFRGDSAIERNLSLSGVNRADAERDQRDYWRREFPWATAKAVHYAYDDAKQTMMLSMDGEATMDWARSGNIRDFDVADSNLGFSTSFKREPGPHLDAPYTVTYPDYRKWVVSIVLPKSGPRFRLVGGGDVNQTIAGVAYWRRSEISDDLATITATQRSLTPEFPASQAVAAEVALRELGDKDVIVRADLPADIGDAAAEQAPKDKPVDAAGFERRGARFLHNGDYASALADYGEAAKLEPKVAKHFYNRGLAQFELGRKDLALDDFNSALRLDPDDQYALIGRGRVYLSRGELRPAAKDLDHAIAAADGDPRVVQEVAKAYGVAGRVEDQLRYTDQVIAQSTDPLIRARLLNNRCYIRGRWGQHLDLALADCDASLALNSEAAGTLDSRGLVLLRMGRFTDAIAAYDTGLKLRPRSADSLFGRGIAQLRSGHAIDGGNDIAAAKAIDPKVEETFVGFGLKP